MRHFCFNDSLFTSIVQAKRCHTILKLMNLFVELYLKYLYDFLFIIVNMSS